MSQSEIKKLSSLTFGAMSLNGAPENFSSQLKVARAAMDSGVSFHASQEYAGGGTFMVLRHAFAEERSKVPQMILKIRCDDARYLRFDVEDALRRLDIERVDIAQLCRAKHDRRPVVDDFLAQGEMWQACQDLVQEGKVGEFVLEIFASFSPDAIRAVEAELFPACIFYFSPGERQTSNELFDLLQKRQTPVLSLRTMWGGYFNQERIDALRAREPHHASLAKYEALRGIYDRSGCASWAEFSLAFLRTMPQVVTSIAGTSNISHLQGLLEADQRARPLAADLAEEIHSLHREWNT